MDFNQQIIAEFRANDGQVETAGFGKDLVLVHHRGAKSGEERIAPLLGIPQPTGWLVAASAAGAPRHPAWFHNLLAHPDIEIEYVGEDGISRADVTARVLDGDERDRGWQAFLERSPGFAGYEERAQGRVIPVVLLERR